ncbi:uncharacterized protein LOC127701242 [Mytilus californianus]|uniref:uncharacterized protein LOC127701242 n=1 Tax=Mytilus californianus TaxID=6549 RepID=UPI002246CC1F|nr:uncharacterized protein LOC127701242 [Mytilus californianus]
MCIGKAYQEPRFKVNNSMAFRQPCSVLAVRYAKCEHMEAKNIMTSIPDNFSMINLFGEHHDAGPLDEKKHEVDIFCSTSLDQKSELFQVEKNLSVGELTNSFHVKCVHFTCKIKEDFVVKNALVNVIQTCAQDATKTAVNAFEVMMAGGRKCVSRKRKSAGMKEGLSRKDELYNNLVDDFESKGLNFPKAVADIDGAYIIQV